jgi:hypothetical protein
MVMRNRAWLFAVLLGLALPLPLWGGGPRQVVKTKWFDIIYPPESAGTAALLAERADALFEQASAAFGVEPWFRLPVTIVPTTDVLNAYFTSLPYNRIVLYDTPPDESLAVYHNDILSVFYHEAVHAVSLNIKPDKLKKASRVFGDFLTSPGFLWSLPQSLEEGASVYYESQEGGGRLNDGFSTHVVKQAKLEGRFPSWYDIAGARDIYPVGALPYFFGGEFTAYLVRTYGVEKYNQFWAAAGRRLYLTKVSAGIFKSVYGVKIADAWAAFRDGLPVPEIAPAAAETLASGGVYSSVTSSEAGTAWLDGASGDVWFLETGAEKARRLLSMKYAQRIAFSRDGAYLAISRFEGSSALYLTNKVTVYRAAGKRLLDAPADSLRDAAVVTVNGKRFLCAVETRSQNAALVYYEIGADRIAKTAAFRLDFPRGVFPYSPVDAGNGLTAFVRKEGLERAVVFFDPASGELLSAGSPLPGINIRNLAASQAAGEVWFSWAAQDTFPRAGRVALAGDEAAFTLAGGDVSGGVYFPAPVSGAELVYCAMFYDRPAILRSAFDEASARRLQAQVTRLPAPQREEAAPPAPAGTRYNPFAYFGRGLFLPGPGPIAIVDENLQTVAATSLGAIYATSTPEHALILGGIAGYDFLTNAYGAHLEIVAHGKYLSNTFSAQGIFNEAQFEQTLVENTFEAVFPVFRNANLVFTDTLDWFYGHSGGGVTAQKLSEYNDSLAGTLEWKDTARLTHTFRNAFGLGFSTLRSRGMAPFSTGGAAVGARLHSWYLQDLSEPFFNNLGFFFTFQVPRLLPFRGPRRLTVNLPFEAGVSLYPASNYREFVNFHAAPTLFAVDVQKALGSLLYLNRFFLEAAYSGAFSQNQASWQIRRFAEDARNIGAMSYTDSLRLSALVTLSGNTGVITNGQVSLGADFIWNLRDKTPFRPDIQFAYRLNLPSLREGSG